MLNKKYVALFSLILIVGMLFIPVANQAHAEKGDFYKAHEDFYEDAPDSYKDFLKDYDSEKRTVKCGKFDVNCHVFKIALDSGVSALDYIKDLMTKTIISPTDITDDDLYNSYKDALTGISKTMLAIFIVFNVTKFVVLRLGDSSDAEGASNEKIVSLFVIAIFLFVYDAIIEWILVLQESVMTAIINSIDSSEMTIRLMTNALMGPGLFSIFVILILALFLIVLFLQLFYRTAIFAVLYIFGPVAIVTKLNDTYNFFDFWLKQIITSFLTLAIQLTTMAIGLRKILEEPAYYGDTYNLFIGVAFFIAAVTIPSLLGQWGASTGSTRAVASGAKSMVKIALMRRR